MACNTLVRPQVEYASSAWDPYVKHSINKIEWFKGVRPDGAAMITHPPPYSSVSAMIDKLGWQTLQQRRSTSR